MRELRLCRQRQRPGFAIRSAWVKEGSVDSGKIAAYNVNVMVTFVLEDTISN
jgi:hypothetical protein